MTDALFEAILAAPEDDAPRLVWADREGGERGELVVIQCMLARRGLPFAERRRLVARETDLLRTNGRSWANIPSATSESFARGFVHRITIPLPALVNEARQLFERAPLLREIAIQNMEGSTNAYRGATAEDIWEYTSSLLASMFASFPADHVRLLSVAPVVYVDSDGWQPPISFARELMELISRTPELAGLDGIELLNAKAGREAFMELPRLERVRVYRASIEPAELASVLPRLVELRTEDPVDDDDLALLARTSVRLKHLGFTFEGRTGLGFEELLASPVVAALESLDLTGYRLDWPDLSELARAPFAARLRELRLHCGVNVTLERAEAMFPALESVRMTQNRPA